MNIIGEIVMPVKRWWRLLHKTAVFFLTRIVAIAAALTLFALGA